MTCCPPADISAAIAGLYTRCGMSPPELPQTIVSLTDLVGGFNLSCVELSGLTPAAVCTYLGEPANAAETESLAGFLYASPRGGVVFVERGHPIQRRRFSAAHELGHYLLHFRPAFERAAALGAEVPALTDAFPKERELLEAPPLGRIAAADPSSALPLLPPLAQMEEEADRFAAELLMPQPLVRALNERYAGQFHDADLAQRMAVDMLVSRAAMFRRLRELGLVGRGEFSPDELN